MSKFFQTSLDREGGTNLNAGDPAIIAKYDMVILNRFHYYNLGGNVWGQIKNLNPNILIYVYQVGMETEGPTCAYDNSICRYSLLSTTYPSLFLTNASNSNANHWITDPDYTDFYLMDFGSSTYSSLWANYTNADIVNTTVKADGIFVDRCDTVASFKTDQYGGVDIDNEGTVSNAAWVTAMNNFSNSISGLMASQKLFLNRGDTRYANGYNAYLALDGMSTPPDAVLEEGAFAVRWGAPAGGVWFYAEAQWKSQVDLMSQIHRSKTVWEASCLTPQDGNGTDQNNRSFNFWDVYWYAMCSYLIGKNTVDNNSYFQFNVEIAAGDANAVTRAGELDTIDLGNALGPYTVSNHIYSRQFQKGTVFVNPGTASATITITGSQLSHANYTTGVRVTSITLPPDRGTIVMTAGTPPSPPTNLRIVP